MSNKQSIIEQLKYTGIRKMQTPAAKKIEMTAISGRKPRWPGLRFRPGGGILWNNRATRIL
jgi:hypothetical protein